MGAFCGVARAQDPLPAPPLPTNPRSGESEVEPVSTPATIDELAQRLRMMEEMNRKLADQVERNNRDMQALLQRIGDLSQRLEASEAIGGGVASGTMTSADIPASREVLESAAGRGAVPPSALTSPVPDYTEGQFAPNEPAPGYPYSNLLFDKRMPVFASFGPGFELGTEDSAFRLRVHLESQIEGRVWGPKDRLPPDSGIDGVYLPRQRIFFDGNITKRIEYEFSINRGLNNLNLLNAYINLHLDDRLQLKIGRYFTPLPYDQYAISNYWLITPERSIFTTNVGLNRQFGAMAWGYLFDEQVDYAAGFFNGSRNSFENTNNAMDFVGYFNARPFQQATGFKLLEFLNLGTSVAYGHQDQAPVPAAFRIAGGSPDTNIPGSATVPFLILNPGVLERGERLLGSVHAAYFRKGLSLIGEWQYGHGSYAAPGRAGSTIVPFSGYYVSAGYFLTGEHVERRSRLYPLRPLIPTGRDQQRGLGAWELASRVSHLGLGESVFRDGLADPHVWSDQATTTELGMNWYWNEYIKMYMFWLHGDFGSPLQVSPGRFEETADMFWLRFQLYF